MSEGILTALIGIMGTALGTVLGWALSAFSRRGRLSIYLSAYHESFEFNNDGEISPASSFDDTEAYFYQLSLNVYNSSCDTKIIRDLRIEFLNGKEVAISSIPRDSDTERPISGGIIFHRNFETLNVPPKSVVPLHLQGGLWRPELENFEKLNSVDNIRIAYKSEKNTDCYVQVGERIRGPRFDAIRDRQE